MRRRARGRVPGHPRLDDIVVARRQRTGIVDVGARSRGPACDDAVGQRHR